MSIRGGQMVECPNCAFRNSESDGFCGSCGLFLWPEEYAGAARTAGTTAGAASRPQAPTAAGGAAGGAGRAGTVPAGRRPEERAAAKPVQCRACMHPNAPARRFCGRCGAGLTRTSGPGAEPAPPAPVVVVPWWRRLLWWHRRRVLPVFRAGTRPGRRQERRPWDPESAVSARAAPGRTVLAWLRRTIRRIWPDVFLMLLILLLILLLGRMFPDARRAVLGLNPYRAEPLDYLEPRSCVEPPAQSGSLTEFPPGFACDRTPETYWATSLSDADETTSTIRERRPRLWVDFTDAVAIHALHLRAKEVLASDLASEGLRDSGRPAKVCVKFYSTNEKRDRHYDAVVNRQSTQGLRPLATLQFPRPPEGGRDTHDCAGLNDDNNPETHDRTIPDDPEPHEFAFEEISGIRAVSIEFRETHDTDIEADAREVFVSGLEFYGKAEEGGEDKGGGEGAQGPGPVLPSRPADPRSLGGPA